MAFEDTGMPGNANPGRAISVDYSPQLALPPQADRGKAPMQGDEERKPFRTETKSPDIKSSGEERSPTIAEVNAVIASLVGTIKEGFVSKSDLSDIHMRLGAIARAIAGFITVDDAKKIAQDAVPASLRYLDNNSQRTGDTLRLSVGGDSGKDSAYWGPSAISGNQGIDWTKAVFGYKINPDGDNALEVKIYAGEVDRHDVTETNIVVANDDYAYVRRTLATDAMAVLNAASVPANDGTYRYYKLYQFTVTDGKAYIKKYHRPFVIDEDPLPNGDATNIHLVWNDTTKIWEKGVAGALPSGGTQYQVLQRDGSGNATWDYVRWV